MTSRKRLRLGSTGGEMRRVSATSRKRASSWTIVDIKSILCFLKDDWSDLNCGDRETGGRFANCCVVQLLSVNAIYTARYRYKLVFPATVLNGKSYDASRSEKCSYHVSRVILLTSSLSYRNEFSTNCDRTPDNERFRSNVPMTVPHFFGMNQFPNRQSPAEEFPQTSRRRDSVSRAMLRRIFGRKRSE
jgi:hypothetical protein